VSLVHFPPACLRVDAKCASPDGSSVGVGLIPGSLPSQPDASMEKLSKGALERSLRWKAIAERHRQALFDTKVALTAAREKIKLKEERMAALESKLRAARQGKKDAMEAAQAETRRRVDVNILNGKTETEARALCGLSGIDSLKVSWM